MVEELLIVKKEKWYGTCAMSVVKDCVEEWMDGAEIVQECEDSEDMKRLGAPHGPGAEGPPTTSCPCLIS